MYVVKIDFIVSERILNIRDRPFLNIDSVFKKENFMHAWMTANFSLQLMLYCMDFDYYIFLQ